MVRKLSPSQKHLNRILAQKALANAPTNGLAVARPATGQMATAYDLLRAQLGEHMAELKGIQARERKIARKIEILPEYYDHIKQVLTLARDENKALQDEVFVRLMIWHLDAAEVDHSLYHPAFDMAEHVLKYDLEMPGNFRRSAATLILEAVAEPALKSISLAGADEVEPFPIAVLDLFEALTHGHDIIDQVTAKLNKALGLLYARKAKAIEAGHTDGPAGGLRAAREEALKRLRRALELDEGIGVKKDIEALTRALNKMDAATAETA